jgi:hypothetical protein
MIDIFKESINEFLKSHGVVIRDCDYKNSKGFAKIKNTWVLGDASGTMTLEEFIERYLLSENEAIRTYESIYDMGNHYELADEECDDIALAKEIIRISESIDVDEIKEWEMDGKYRDKAAERKAMEVEGKTIELVDNFNRKGGLKERLKSILNFDLALFEKNNTEHKAEICKIIYFFHMLENKHIPKMLGDSRSYFNVLQFFDKPSMENIDNSFLGMETRNGIIIKYIKTSLEKELSLQAKANIKNAISYIVGSWDEFLDNKRIHADFLAGYGCECNFDEIINLLNSVSQKPLTSEKITGSRWTQFSPIETLYLKVVQHEYLGQIKDISTVNSIQIEADYDVPSDLIEEMKQLDKRKIDINNIEKYIDENALKIEKYIYFRTESDKENRRRIRDCKEKVVKLIEFCSRARPLVNMENVLTELFIISCLQAILTDSGNETFNYTFYGYQNYQKRKPQVQGALKGDKSPNDALKNYWVRKVMDHWYANIGRYGLRSKLRELEMICDDVIRRILACSNIDEMLKTHSSYYNKISE